MNLSKINGDYYRCSILAIPAIINLFNSGSMHADARDENIFVKQNEGSNDFKIIDWQYASFSNPRNDWMLEHLAAFFIRNAPENEKEKLLNNWIYALYEQANYEIEFEKFFLRVKSLLNSRQPVSNRKKNKPGKLKNYVY